MPIKKNENAYSKGLWIRCKGRNCRKEFEIIVGNKDR